MLVGVMECGSGPRLSHLDQRWFTLRFGGKHPHNRVVRTLLTPGLWLQSLTTREPTLDQVEVSINALRDVLQAEERSQAERGLSRVEVMA